MQRQWVLKIRAITSALDHCPDVNVEGREKVQTTYPTGRIIRLLFLAKMIAADGFLRVQGPTTRVLSAKSRDDLERERNSRTESWIMQGRALAEWSVAAAGRCQGDRPGADPGSRSPNASPKLFDHFSRQLS